MTPTTYRLRLERVRQALHEHKLHALVVLNLASIRYLTGFTGSAGILLIGREGWATLVTDGRYKLQAREQTHGINIRITLTRQHAKVIARTLKGSGAQFVGVEKRYCTLAFFEALQDALKRDRARLSGVEGILEELRAVKDEQEVQLIRQAAQLSDAAFEHALKVLRVGMTEKELAWELEAFLRTHGAEALAFPPIVLSGERTALPHGQPSERCIRKGDLVTLDWGAKVQGYCSDLTRTIVVGKPTEEQQRLYRAVWEAQRRGIEALPMERKAVKVDRVVRQTIKEHGLDKFFTHGTGHGVGLEVHETPALGRQSKDTLKAGMVVTVEPGIYVPNFGGVRIEDLVWLTGDGVEPLSRAPNPPKILSV